MSRPSKRTRPASGLSSPLSCPIKVVLPAPFGPITACSSPAGTSSVISSDASTPPKRLVTPSICNSGSATTHALQQSIDTAAREQDDQQEQRAQHDRPVFGGANRQIRLHNSRGADADDH